MPTAIITGASKGIGSAIAHLLVKEGFDIAICARTESDLLQLKAELQALNSQASIVTLSVDVSKEDQVQTFAQLCLNEFGHIDILVNNAGVFIPGEILNLSSVNLKNTIDTNLMSAFWMTNAIVPRMIAQKKGHIFNMCSVASLQAYPNGGAYSISKYALLGFSDNLRFELKDKHVKVTAICPGAVYTDSWKLADVDPLRLMDARDVAESLWSAYQLSSRAVVERIVLRPQLGDL